MSSLINIPSVLQNPESFLYVCVSARHKEITIGISESVAFKSEVEQAREKKPTKKRHTHTYTPKDR